ncbi:GntR family transcriptional regulator, partial [Promicromonospora kroppenstedtii]|uniref:GntR family transcriptional regulator n=1 Tax=Promicromonospora kroppenstedtii TaxID=440482 RepID=UPI000568D5CD
MIGGWISPWSSAAAPDAPTRSTAPLHSALTTGRVPAGERLPSTRDLARDLGVSRASVATAYERLVAEGFLETRTGAGTFATAA